MTRGLLRPPGAGVPDGVGDPDALAGDGVRDPGTLVYFASHRMPVAVTWMFFFAGVSLKVSKVSVAGSY
jgi:hypothetical protein